MDVHDKSTRSFNMSMIKGKNTKPEELVRKHLFSQGFRYRKNVNTLPGSPDIVLSKYRTVVFVNGCFWHGHTGCKYFVWPKSNSEFWKNKIEQNRTRDERVTDALQQLHWNVVTIWECQLKKNIREQTLSALVDQIKRNGANQHVK